jgi:hypothetical protein
MDLKYSLHTFNPSLHAFSNSGLLLPLNKYQDVRVLLRVIGVEEKLGK